MARGGEFLQCVLEAVAVHGVKFLLGFVPFGHISYNIAEETMNRYSKRVSRNKQREDLEDMMRKTTAETQAMVNERYPEILKNIPEKSRAEFSNPEVKERLMSYALQIPPVFSASMQQVPGQMGISVPSNFSFNSPDDIKRVIPKQVSKFKIGDRPIGNWKLTECLGIGGYGEVWRAEHYSMPNICAALKFCLAPESKKSLLHEGKLLNQVMKLDKLDGIVKLRNAFLDIENPCLEYDYINGGNLGAVINFQNNIESSKRHLKALQILKRLTQIMVPLHAMNPAIIHRDLKPTNILLSKTNGKFEIFIADFGIGAIISKINIDEENKEKDPTYSGASLLGTHTPDYCSPEQKKHALPHPADDIHALGIIAYQLIVGSIFKIPNHGFDVDLLESGVSPNFVTILKRCVDGKRERRYANAGELLNAINSLSTQTKPSPTILPQTLVVTEPIEAVSKPKTPKLKESEKLEVYDEEEDKNIVEQLAAGYNYLIASLSAGAPQYHNALQIIGGILCGLLVLMVLPWVVLSRIGQQNEITKIEENKKNAEKEQLTDNLMKKVVGTWISQDTNLLVEFTNNICSLRVLSNNTSLSKTISSKSVKANALHFMLNNESNRFVIDFDSQGGLLMSNDISKYNDMGDNAITKLLAGKFMKCTPDQIKKIPNQNSSQNSNDKSNALAQEQEVSKIMQKVVGTWISANGNMTVQFTNNICAFSAISFNEVRSKNIVEKSIENGVLNLKVDTNTFTIDFDDQNNLLISNNVSSRSSDIIRLLAGKFIRCTPEQIKNLSKQTTDNLSQKKYDGFNSFIEQPKAPAMPGKPPG